MSEQEERISTRIALVEKEFGVVNDMFRRFENAIDKMSEVTVNVQRMLALHERRLDEQANANTRLQELVDRRREDALRAEQMATERLDKLSQDLRQVLREEIGSLATRVDEKQTVASATIEKLERRIASLESWRWFILGGSAVVGIVASRLPALISLLSSGG